MMDQYNDQTIYEGTIQYNLIYIFAIHDAAHKDYLKIGEHSFSSYTGPTILTPNCDELNKQAHVRIRQYTNTALVQYELLYTELARKQVRLSDGTVEATAFSDHDVHEVLYRSGYDARKFYDSGKDSEWFRVTLAPAIAAIRAVKQGRNTLTAAEKGEPGQASFSQGAAKTNRPRITLREEQQDCIARTKKVFQKGDRMLWDCKMRFGKTVTAYSLVKEMGYKKVLVVTHRPAVVDGWRTDFDLIFEGTDRVFLTKANIKAGDRFTADDASIDAENDRQLANLVKSGKPFVYFASIQDLRGSQLVGGPHKKNRGVFSLNWDIIIYDEAHEGTQTELGLNVQQLLEQTSDGSVPKKVLQLSGTPYNLLSQYDADTTYSWDYVMEQRKKQEWDEKHPGDYNPYADLPELRICTFDLRNKLATSYRYEDSNVAFNFREFFRTWTGDPERDFQHIPEGVSVGEFVHESDVNAFLDLISADSQDSNYPFATEEFRATFKHTFWILPGVKEARAFSALLKKHPVFRNYEIVNVAGEGDVEKPYDDALAEVKSAIDKHEYTITLSCGKLTTGVTVKQWTGVMLLSGSSSTGAAGYMQTIFRVQSAGSIDGKQKKVCYAFDFAPDRALKVISEVHQLKKRAVGSDDPGRIQLGEFLNFCPVLAEGDTGMVAFDVPRLMRQIKRLTVDAAVKSGFDDDSIYKADAGIVMDGVRADLLDRLRARLSPQAKAKKPTSVDINRQGLNEEEYQIAQKAKSKPKKARTPKEEEALAKEKEMRKKQQALFDLLRNVSIRLPLLIYGTATEFDESIRLEDFIDIVDKASWREFMPKSVDKQLFREMLVFYDRDVIEGAGMRIRRMAKAADEMLPTQRVLRIAEIFSYFKNPAKETVLTPWRVVNLHMGNSIGGYNFYAEGYPERDGLLDEPRVIDLGKPTEDIFLNESVRVLEMNSKSGLYPLYIAYSIYRLLLPKPEAEMSVAEANMIWDQVLLDHLYVLCQTSMAVSITKRTLAGYRHSSVNARYLPRLISDWMDDMPRLARKLTNPATWGKVGDRLKFEAIVGNPPYQMETGQQQSTTNGQVPRTNIFHLFQIIADRVSSGYTSLIYPGGRWMHRYGKGQGFGQFALDLINDPKLEKIDFFADAEEIFKSVDLADGISLVFKNMRKTTPGFTYVYHKGGMTTTVTMNNPGDELIALNPQDGEIVQKVVSFVRNNNLAFLHDRVLQRDFFGIESSYVEEHPQNVKEFTPGYELQPGEIKLLTNDKAGKAGRAKWYVANQSVIESNPEFISQWQVVVSSANAGGQKRDNQIEIMDNHSAYGRARVALGTFKTETEAGNFYNYCKTKLVRFMFLMTDEALTSLGKKVPDLMDYTSNNQLIDFCGNLDDQLFALFKITPEEVSYIESVLRAKV